MHLIYRPRRANGLCFSILYFTSVIRVRVETFEPKWISRLLFEFECCHFKFNVLYLNISIPVPAYLYVDVWVTECLVGTLFRRNIRIKFFRRQVDRSSEQDGWLLRTKARSSREFTEWVQIQNTDHSLASARVVADRLAYRVPRFIYN